MQYLFIPGWIRGLTPCEFSLYRCCEHHKKTSHNQYILCFFTCFCIICFTAPADSNCSMHNHWSSVCQLYWSFKVLHYASTHYPVKGKGLIGNRAVSFGPNCMCYFHGIPFRQLPLGQGGRVLSKSRASFAKAQRALCRQHYDQN